MQSIIIFRIRPTRVCASPFGDLGVLRSCSASSSKFGREFASLLSKARKRSALRSHAVDYYILFYAFTFRRSLFDWIILSRFAEKYGTRFTDAARFADSYRKPSAGLHGRCHPRKTWRIILSSLFIFFFLHLPWPDISDPSL